MQPQYLDTLPDSMDVPIAHAMTEYALELFCSPKATGTKRALAHAIGWIDASIAEIQKNTDRKTRRLNPDHSKKAPLFCPDVKRPDTCKKNTLASGTLGLDIKCSSMWVFRARSVDPETQKHKIQLRIDPEIDIGEIFHYEMSAIYLDTSQVPETLMNNLIIRIQNGEKPVFLSELADIEIAGKQFPQMPITGFDDNDNADTYWYTLDKSWEEWKSMRARIIARHGIKKIPRVSKWPIKTPEGKNP